MVASEVVAIVGILVLGTLAQTIAYRLRLPSILLLLLFGVLAGPVLGWLDPDALLGDLLPPLIALGVAIVLFEGGLGLDMRALRGQTRVVVRLVTLGVLVTWGVGAVVAVTVLGLPTSSALLLGAILVVSGPTVVIPLLRSVRPERSLDTTLRWEGILVDPIGAVLAVVVFEAMQAGVGTAPLLEAGQALFGSIVVGGGVGLLAALLLVAIEARYWVPDHLSSAVSLALVVAAYAAAETGQGESGLLAVTVMGVVIANQRRVNVHHILDFKESLSMILLGGLFILLAARMPREALLGLDWRAAVIIAALVLVARPLAVAVSTWGSDMTWRQRVFLASMAPRGIVAAAVAAFFALRLAEAGRPEAALFVPITFSVVVATVAIYGLAARPIARWLGVAQPDAQGVLFIGANPVTRELAAVLQQEGYRAVLVDNNPAAVTAARIDGLEAARADILSLHLTDDLDLAGLGRLWAMTANDEVNSLAAVHFTSIFGRAHCYQLAAPEASDQARHEHLRGRVLFGADMTYRRLRNRTSDSDWTVRRTPITESFTDADHARRYPDRIRLFLVRPDRRIRVFTRDHAPAVEPGCTLVAWVRESASGEEE